MIPPATQSDYTETALGLLPMSHIYGLVVICHGSAYRGDSVVVLPKFEFASTLQAIQKYKVNTLYLVSWLNTELLHNRCRLTSTRYLQSSS
jgi:acyl-CoA synthetase (AMP-forming)/AMP-acid ligase II